MPTARNLINLKVAVLAGVFLVAGILTIWLLAREPVFPEHKNLAVSVIDAANAVDRDKLIKLIGNPAAADTLIEVNLTRDLTIKKIYTEKEDFFTIEAQNSKISSIRIFMSRLPGGAWLANIP